ncbi:MAG: hypothetical protein WCS99_00790 [Limisphaerales bacterium]
MKVSLCVFRFVFACILLCWPGATASFGQSLANFTGAWNFTQFSTPAVLTLATVNSAVSGTNYVTLQDIQEKTNFMARAVPMTIDSGGNFSGPANGVLAVVGPGLLQATPSGQTPALFNVNAAEDVAVAVLRPPDSNQQELMLMLKVPSTLTASDLTGTWKMVSLGTPLALQPRLMTNYFDPQHPVEGVSDIDGRYQFDTGNGTLTVAADGSFTLVFGTDTMNGTATPGAGGLVQVTIPMPPNPTMNLSFYVNQGKNVMTAVHAETNYQELLVAVKLPASSHLAGESLGFWRAGSFETPGGLTLLTNALGFVSDIPEKNNFSVHREKIHIGHTGMFTLPSDQSLGLISIPSPGTVQISATNAAGESFSNTMWANSSKDFLITTKTGSTHEVTFVTRAPTDIQASGGAEFGLILQKTNQPSVRVDFFWASAANRMLQTSTNLVDWTDIPETQGGFSHRPPMGSFIRAYYRLRQTPP